MSYQITSDNIELSQSMVELAKSKLIKIERHRPANSPDENTFRIVMNSAPDQQFTVKIEAAINGKRFFSDETHNILESAIILAIEELDRQIDKEFKKEKTDDWEKMREMKRFDPEE